MIVINRLACSSEFSAALDAVEAGREVRRASWTDGMVLRKQDDRVEVIRPRSQIAPAWQGSSTEESNASDWHIVQVG